MLQSGVCVLEACSIMPGVVAVVQGRSFWMREWRSCWRLHGALRRRRCVWQSDLKRDDLLTHPLCCGRYTGEKLLDERVEVLLEAAWRPAPEGAFPDLPQSPRANGSASSAAAPTAAQGYVAPHLRGTGACRRSSRLVVPASGSLLWGFCIC